MSKCLKKLFAITIALAILIACIPTVSVFAETASGTCGESVTWSLDTESGILTISGSGDMYDYYSWCTAPWYSQSSSIKSANIENGVTSIGNDAFYGCNSLSSITIPDSVTGISSDAFDNTAYYNNEDNWTNDVLFIDNHLIEAKDSLSGEYIIPAGTKTIAEEAFSGCSSLTSVTIPDSVTSIDSYAFSLCSSLTSITIPNGVTSIGNYTFSGCSSLTSVTIPDSVTSIGWSAFEDCSSLTSITIPNGVTSIGAEAFYNCSSLTSVTIPDSVTHIGYYAFLSCSNIEKVYITDLASWCTIDFDVYSNPMEYAQDLYLNGTKLTILNIPDGVTKICWSAFNGCSSVTSVTIPDSVTIIDDYAFFDCSSLSSITIPDSVTSIGSRAFNNTAYYNNEDNWTNDVLFIDNHLISAKGSLSGEYIIPAGTKTIADGAFEDCSSLTSVTIPDGVTSIGGGAFSGCSSLASVTIPNSVKSIGGGAFWGCSSLSSVTISDSVTSIGEDAFYGCNNLTIRCYKNSAAHNYAIENNISYTLINGDVTVGDANGDGRINNKDLGLLMQKLNGWTVEIDDAVADVNADGKVNNKDYGLLMQYVNGWEVVIG